jgi:hypothetical protein
MKHLLRTNALELLVGFAILFVAVLPASAQPGSVVEITTLMPAGPYEALGVVAEIAQKPSAIFDAGKAVREGITGLFPGLEAQAKTHGANVVVLTQIVPVADSGGVYFIGIGTAIRIGRSTGGGGAPQAAPSEAQQIAPAGQASPRDLSGRWVGKLLEAGQTVPIDAAVNLMPGATQGTFTGGLTISDPKCEMTLKDTPLEGDTVTFKQDKASLFRCDLFTTHVVTLMPDGKLDWKVFRMGGKKPHFQGVVERQ